MDRITTEAIAASSLSGNLDLTGFFVGANIPTTAIIRGIQVEIVRKASGTSVDDEDLYLLKAGATTGITDHASGTDWGTTDGTVTYGSASDLWGTTWTPAQINASNFGVRFKVGNRTTSSRTASINRIRCKVTDDCWMGLGGNARRWQPFVRPPTS